MIGGPLKHKRHFYTNEQKQSMFLSEFVKLFNLKGTAMVNHNRLLQGYMKEIVGNEDIENPTMTPLKVFEKLNNEKMGGYFKDIICHFNIGYDIQKCEDGHVPKHSRYYENDATFPIIIIPYYNQTIPENSHHLLKFDSVKDQVENYFNGKSSEFVICNYQGCKKKQLKTITRDVEPCLPEEGFLVKPCKSLLMEQDNNYLKLGNKDIKLKDDEGVSTFLPVSGIREEFGYFVTYLKKNNTWFKFSNSIQSPEIVAQQEIGYCDYIFYVNDSLDPDGSLSESSE